MATPTIKIDGSVSGAGTPGQSRDDLVLGETLTFTDPANGSGTYAWTLRDKPIGSTATLSGAATSTATLVPDVAGTYTVSLLFDGTDESGSLNAIGEFITTQGGAGVKLDFGVRVPAAGETKQYGTTGWHPALDFVLRKHDSMSGCDKHVSPSGVISGGAVTKSATVGDVDITAGTGFVNSGSGTAYVTWSSGSKTLPSDEDSVWIYVDSSGTLQTSTTEPSGESNIVLACGSTDDAATGIRFLVDHRTYISQRIAKYSEFMLKGIGPIAIEGIEASENSPPSLKLDVTAGSYFARGEKITNSSGSAITFTYWWRDGSGGWNWNAGQTEVDPNYYDNGSGTLQAVPASKWKQDQLYVAELPGGPEYHVVYSQGYADTQLDAEKGLCPTPPYQLCCMTMRIACIVTQQGATDIAGVNDRRPLTGQHIPPVAQITDHGELAGLADDDHTQYQKESEKDAANGYCGLDANAYVPKARLGGLLDAASANSTTPVNDATGSFVTAGVSVSPPSDGTYLVIFEGECVSSTATGGVEIAIGKSATVAETGTPRGAVHGTDKGHVMTHHYAALLSTDTIYGIFRRLVAGTGTLNNRRITLVRVT